MRQSESWLPKELDRKQQGTANKTEREKAVTEVNLTQMKNASAGSVSRLSAVLQGTSDDHSPKEIRKGAWGGAGSSWDAPKSQVHDASDSPPMTPEFAGGSKRSHKRRPFKVGNVDLSLQRQSIMDDLWNRPAARSIASLYHANPSDLTSLPLGTVSNSDANKRHERKRQTCLPGVLDKLRDVDGLDSPTIIRHGNQTFAEGQLEPSSPKSPLSPTTHGSFIRKTNSVPELKRIGSSNLAARRHLQVIKATEEAKNGWREGLPNVRTLLKLERTADLMTN